MTREQISKRITDIRLNTGSSMDFDEKLIGFIEQVHNHAYANCKAIFAAEIRNEIFKTRNPDPDKNKDIINIIGGCYTAIEIEVQKKLTRSQEGEHILSIYPNEKMNQ